MLNDIDLSEIVQFVKASIIAIIVYLKISNSHFLSNITESSEWRLKPGFRKICSFPLIGIPSIKVIDTKIMPVGIFPRLNLVSLECECPLNRDLPKEKFHCMVKTVKKNYISANLPDFSVCKTNLNFLRGRKGKSN